MKFEEHSNYIMCFLITIANILHYDKTSINCIAKTDKAVYLPFVLNKNNRIVYPDIIDLDI